MATDTDVLVVGSGFGGGLSALRYAEAGARTLVLERGPWFGRGGEGRPAAVRREFPRGRALPRLVRNVRISRGGRDRNIELAADGLYEWHAFRRLHVATASGVGGGSLTYTNMIVEPPPVFLDEIAPLATLDEWSTAVDRVRGLLDPSPIPTLPRLTAALLDGPRRADERVTVPAQAVAWANDPAQPARVPGASHREQCSFCGECLIGCRSGAKHSVDATIIERAVDAGATVEALIEVRCVERVGARWVVHAVDHRRHRAVSYCARRVVLAAGALNSIRILLESRYRHRSIDRLPARLGHDCSPNGDALALMFGIDDTARPTGVGPSTDGYLEVHGDSGHDFLVIPFVPPSAAFGPFTSLVDRCGGLFAMGRDSIAGETTWNGRGVSSSIGPDDDRAFFDRVGARFEDHAERLGARRLLHVRGSRTGRFAFTVHPVGGARMSADPEFGATDLAGELHGLPGLYVADGSLLPAPPGVPPTLSIAALVEITAGRAVERALDT